MIRQQQIEQESLIAQKQKEFEEAEKVRKEEDELNQALLAAALAEAERQKEIVKELQNELQSSQSK